MTHRSQNAIRSYGWQELNVMTLPAPSDTHDRSSQGHTNVDLDRFLFCSDPRWRRCAVGFPRQILRLLCPLTPGIAHCPIPSPTPHTTHHHAAARHTVQGASAQQAVVQAWTYITRYTSSRRLWKIKQEKSLNTRGVGSSCKTLQEHVSC